MNATATVSTKVSPNTATNGAEATARKPKVLCVDDEPLVGEGLMLQLGRRFDVHTATSGAEGLELLETLSDWAVVISDMRMPVMDGASFLAAARMIAPDATRMLLTGYADFGAAIDAVNRGHIFRFMQKPCAPPELNAAVDAAVQQHRLVTAERELLERTLFGSVQSLVDVIALSNPLAFGRATRVRERVARLAEKLRVSARWQVEMAVLMAHLGYITLPADLIERSQAGQALQQHERDMLARVPEVAEQLLGHIPRLEPVRAMIAQVGRPYHASADLERDRILRGASLITMALELDALELQGKPMEVAVTTLRARASHFAPGHIEALEALSEAFGGGKIKEVMMLGLRIGMSCAEEVRLSNGSLLAPKGYIITGSFIERLRNMRPGTVKEPLLVITKI